MDETNFDRLDEQLTLQQKNLLEIFTSGRFRFLSYDDDGRKLMHLSRKEIIDYYLDEGIIKPDEDDLLIRRMIESSERDANPESNIDPVLGETAEP